MPSGAKKRKAAKKKKEKENSINPQGNGELKSQDEKGSDGGEGSSPAYHDNGDQHHPFNGGSEEVEERDPSAVQQPASDAKSVEEGPSDINFEDVEGGNEVSVFVIERDLKSEKSSGAENVSFDHIEIAKESCYGNGNTGANSNDESLTEKNSKDKNYNSVEEAIACHELVDSSTSKTTLIAENVPMEETGNLAAESSVHPFKAVATMSDVENSDTVSVLLEKSVGPPLGVTDLAVKINEDNVSSLTDEKARISSLEEPKTKEYDNEVLASLAASLSAKLTNGAEHIEDSKTPACSENQALLVAAQMVQKTPWWSCCGLFEVLPVSNR